MTKHDLEDRSGGWDAEAFQRMAAWSFWLPLVGVFVLRMAASSLKHAAGPSAKWSALIILVLYCLLGVVSLCLAITALCGVRRHGAQGILIRGVLGVIVSGGLLGLMAINFVAVDRIVVRARSAMATPGNDRRPLDVLGEHAAALQAVTNMNVLHFGGVKKREDLMVRREAMLRLLAATEALGELWREQAAKLEAGTEPNSSSPADIESQRSSGERDRSDIVLAKNLCVYQRQSALATIEMLELLDANWGTWRCNPRSGQLEIDKVAVLNEWIRLRDLLIASEREQSRLTRARSGQSSIWIGAAVPPE